MQFSQLHHAPVCWARFDHCHPVWHSDRASPSGILLLDRKPDGGLVELSYPDAVPDGPSRVSTVGAAGAIAGPTPILLLEYIQGLHALAPADDSAAVGSPSCGRTQPLFPAPDFMLKGPQHPAYTMEPTLWAPFKPGPHMSTFLTPYHRGWFRTSFTSAQSDYHLGPQVRTKSLYSTDLVSSNSNSSSSSSHRGSHANLPPLSLPHLCVEDAG